ncbi:MAG: methyltransferase domain-containing protein [Chloroflexi bacterium]|nr:methyltransferase domain-containing protein [Chloroflexota bacterium]
MTGEWSALWRELATHDVQAGAEGERQMVSRWRRVAQELDAGGGLRPGFPDPLLDVLLSRLTPDMAVVDIGAGVGRWTVPIARKVRQVTAVEPTPGMREVLHERLARLGVANVTVLATPWMEVDLEPHDVAIASHSTYTSPDLLAFVRRMEACARAACYLALRVPAHDGAIGELSARLRGQWHDSPNFTVGFNLLLAAGIYPNVLMENAPVRRWTDATLEDAVERAKRHLRLEGAGRDAEIRECLGRRLQRVDGAYRWPDGMRSALLYWDTP